MQRVLIVGGILGFGSALVFGAAALTATLFPTGPLVPGGWNGQVMIDRGVGIGGGIALPMPAPVVDEGKDLEVPADQIGLPEDGTQAQPGPTD